MQVGGLTKPSIPHIKSAPIMKPGFSGGKAVHIGLQKPTAGKICPPQQKPFTKTPHQNPLFKQTKPQSGMAFYHTFSPDEAKKFAQAITGFAYFDKKEATVFSYPGYEIFRDTVKSIEPPLVRQNNGKFPFAMVLEKSYDLPQSKQCLHQPALQN